MTPAAAVVAEDHTSCRYGPWCCRGCCVQLWCVQAVRCDCWRGSAREMMLTSAYVWRGNKASSRAAAAGAIRAALGVQPTQIPQHTEQMGQLLTNLRSSTSPCWHELLCCYAGYCEKHRADAPSAVRVQPAHNMQLTDDIVQPLILPTLLHTQTKQSQLTPAPSVSSFANT